LELSKRHSTTLNIPRRRYRAIAVINTLPDIALAAWYAWEMKKKKKQEVPVPFVVRLYKKQRVAVSRAAKKQTVASKTYLSEAEIVRHAVDGPISAKPRLFVTQSTFT
jgi:hypothetical protein